MRNNSTSDGWEGAQPPPPYSVTDTIKLRDKIYDATCRHVGTILTGEDFEILLNDVRSSINNLGDRGKASVGSSLSYLAGRELTQSDLYRAAWRLAGNLRVVKSGIAVPPWSPAVPPCWCLVQVTSVQRSLNRENYFNVSLQVMAGPACPESISRPLSGEACAYAARKSGCGPPWKPTAYRHPLDLVSMRLFVLVQAGNDGITFSGVRCPDSLKNGWNRDILRGRARITAPCKYDFNHACRQCPVGYGDCVFSSHADDYTAGVCSACGQVGWLSPGLTRCVRCEGLV